MPIFQTCNPCPIVPNIQHDFPLCFQQPFHPNLVRMSIHLAELGIQRRNPVWRECQVMTFNTLISLPPHHPRHIIFPNTQQMPTTCILPPIPGVMLPKWVPCNAEPRDPHASWSSASPPLSSFFHLLNSVTHQYLRSAL